MKWSEVIDYETSVPDGWAILFDIICDSFSVPTPWLRWFEVSGDAAIGSTHWEAGFIAIATNSDDEDMTLEIMAHECAHMILDSAEHNSEFWNLVADIINAVADNL